MHELHSLFDLSEIDFYKRRHELYGGLEELLARVGVLEFVEVDILRLCELYIAD